MTALLEALAACGAVLAVVGAGLLLNASVAAHDWWADRGLEPWERDIRARERAWNVVLSESGQHQKKDASR